MSNATWKMGAEVKCSKEPAMAEITVEEFQTLLEAKIKLDIITRYFEKDKYFSLEEFNAVTGYEVQRKEEGKQNGDTV